MKYEIVEFIDASDEATYQVYDDRKSGYCTNAGGQEEDTPYFSLAVEMYCELTGEDPGDFETAHRTVQIPATL